MEKCAYCGEPATTEDAMGLPTCSSHQHEADSYYERRTGRKPNEDSFLYCDEHCDLWKADCERCEQCCQHHYGRGVKEQFGDAATPEARGVTICEIEDTTKPQPQVG